jgi:hypothetical protein
MASDKEYRAPDINLQVERIMSKCETCGAWWSASSGYPKPPPSLTRCPCGGLLRAVDMEAHLAGLPKKAYDVDKDKK